MSTHFFQGEISQETIIPLISMIDEDEEDVIDLYFSSEGGDMAMAEMFIDYLAVSPKDITLIGHWSLLSAALEIYCRAVCTKRLLGDAYGMVHLVDRSISLRDTADKNSMDYFLSTEASAVNKRWLDEHKSFFTRKEIDRMKHGGEVYLRHERPLEYVERFAYKIENDKVQESIP